MSMCEVIFIKVANLQRRHWCFTLFVEDEKDYETLVVAEGLIRFAVWQLERCPESQRLHIQGYIEYTRSVRMGTVKQALGESVHLEQRLGTREQAIEYCRKDDSRVRGPWTTGSDNLSQGKRTDLDSIALCIREGGSLDDVVEEYPSQYIRYRRGIEALYHRRARLRGSQWRDVTVLVYHGDAGTGKTRRAISECVGGFFILDQGERVWFDGYEGQCTLIIDDFYGWIKYGQLLRLLDGHPYRCEIKGGFTWALWTRVVITSNKAPADWYAQGMTDALERRINEIVHFEN